MRLRSVEVLPYAVPFREPYVTARGVLRQREMVLLRVRNEEGAVGLGEAVPLSLRGGVSLAEIVRELEQVSEVDPPALSAPARAALAMALLDLRLQVKGEPAGGGGPVACNATLVAGPPEAVAEEALRWRDAGYRTFKLKLGAGEDIAQVEAVRDALGPEPRIRVDANGAWSLEAATEILGALEPLSIELAEQPVASLEEAVRLASATSIPLAGDESIASRADAEAAFSRGAFAIAGIKLSKVGGQDEGMQIAGAMPSFVSSALDGPVGIAAGAHLAASIREREVAKRGPIAPFSQLDHGLATQRLFASTIAAVECELRDGMLHPPPGPGLGVEIDEDALAAHRL
jgi:L-Ala-D/L-Glu epimerase